MLLVLTFVVAVLTLGSGRATVMQGAVHLVLFAAFIFLAFFPYISSCDKSFGARHVVVLHQLQVTERNGVTCNRSQT